MKISRKLHKGKKDVLGHSVLDFDGSRECVGGSVLRMYQHEDKTVVVGFKHHQIIAAKLFVNHFEADEKVEAFKTLNVEGIDKDGNRVELTLFMKPEVLIEGL